MTNNFNLEEFSKSVGSLKGAGVGKAQGMMTKEFALKVVEAIKTDLNTNTKEEAMALVSGLVQNGGSNKNAGGTVSYSLGTKTLTALKFAEVCRKVGGGTPRQFCRTGGNSKFCINPWRRRRFSKANEARLSKLIS